MQFLFFFFIRAMLRFVGNQETVHQKPKDQKVVQSNLLAYDHSRLRDNFALMVVAFLRCQEHWHIYDGCGRESRGLYVKMQLLLWRVWGEPKERKQRKRNDNLTFMPLNNAHSFLILQSNRAHSNHIHDRIKKLLSNMCVIVRIIHIVSSRIILSIYL